MSDLRARLNKILDLHGQALAEAVGQREPKSTEACLSDRDLVLRFAGSDPTPGKSRTQWLIKTYIADEQFKLEDLGRVDAALAAFERFKRKLPVEQRELSRLTRFRDLEALVDPFVKAEERARLTRDLSSATGRELRRLEEAKARDESIIIQEGKGLPTIAVPMTEFASKWWGRGTQWCTAADKNNAFAQYHQDAPLIAIVCPDGAKFQMHVQSDTFQFMDNTDENVSEETIRERWNDFQALLYWAIEQNGEALYYVPNEYRTPELCRIAIKQNGLALYSVPTNHRTPEVCRMAVQQNSRALDYVPENERIAELCRLAVEQDGNALLFVNKIPPGLCRLAVKQNGQALRYVPEHKKTSELCRLAVEQDGLALQLILENERTTELCRLAIEQNGMALQYVPENKRTHELCCIAVEQDGEALQYVPENLRTPELYRMTIEQNGMVLRYVPNSIEKDYRTLDLCRSAIEQNGGALRFVPKDKRTSELCRLAVQHYGLALEYVPKDEKTSDICHLAVEQNGLALQYIPKNKKTPELCRIAIKQNGNVLPFVPKEHKTPELLALISPMHSEWHPDVLQGLHSYLLSSCKGITQNQDDRKALDSLSV
jgi:Domain of unknown function (DUF4116)